MRIMRIAAAVLAFLLWIPSVPVQAQGRQNTPDGEVSEINELYLGDFSEAQLRAAVRPVQENVQDVRTEQSDAGFATVTDAGAYLRQTMKERAETVAFLYRIPKEGYDSSTDAFRTLTRSIWDEALEHTGDPVEGDYLKWQWANWKASRTTEESDETYDVTITYTITWFTTAAQEEEVTAAVNRIIASFALPENCTQYDKILQIYEWVTTHIRYADDGTVYCHSCHAALVPGEAVCQGYALSVYRLALSLGIDVRLIPGTVGGQNHGWNIIELEGMYYNLDPTWDGTYMEGGKAWFLKGSEQFTSRIRWNSANRYDYESADFHARYPMSMTDYDDTRIKGIKEMVTSLYQKCLSRSPDQKGLLNWAGLLYYGRRTAAQVVTGFTHSAEFIRKNVSDGAFTDICYKVFLNRAADASGRKHWTGILADGLSRDYVLRGFLNSSEFSAVCQRLAIEKGTIPITEIRDRYPKVTAFVARLYTKALNRSFDKAGINDWVARIVNGTVSPKQTALNGFLASPEFLRRNLNNEEYIRVLYRVFLDREGEAAGIRSWTRQLQGGKTREQVAAGFADSAEFAALLRQFGI